MSIFGKKNSNTGSTSSATNQQSSGKLTLIKAENSLERHIINLKKKGIRLNTHKARVFVVLDISGSMSHLFRNGVVQNTLTRLLPLALRFDDNGELECYVFNNSYARLEPVTLRNYNEYVTTVIMPEHSPNGGTSYAPVLNATLKDHNDGNELPAFGIFITDGENNDVLATNDIIRKSSNYKIFYQFVGIGLGSFRYLKKLDDLKDRKVDNTSFIKVRDLEKLRDDELYEKLLEQYPQWLSAMGIS